MKRNEALGAAAAPRPAGPGLRRAGFAEAPPRSSGLRLRLGFFGAVFRSAARDAGRSAELRTAPGVVLIEGGNMNNE